MKRIAGIALAVALSGAAGAALAQEPTVEHFSQSDLLNRAQQLEQQAVATGSASAKISEYPNHFTMIALRKKNGGAEVHEKYADIFFVVQGRATLVTGGAVVDPQTASPGEIRGTLVKDGASITLKEGDVVHIPAKVPHQILLAGHKSFVLFCGQGSGTRMRNFVPTRKPARILCMGLTAALLCAAPQLRAQAPEKQSTVGDAPAIAIPFAKDLSGKLTRRDVRRAMRRVAEWQLNRAEPAFDQDWTFAALYAGFMAVPDAAGGKRYREAMLRMGKQFNWQPGPRLAHADDQAVGQTYLDLYQRQHDPAMIAPIRARMDAVMQLPDDKAKPLWWWCDALFIAPPVLTKLATITGDHKYLDFMDREWWVTSSLLYDNGVHLYYRDASFLTRHEANGSGLFWSRGNGWVMAGLVRVLAEMPPDYPSRPKYVAQFKEMTAEIATLQGSDGLWRPGLLNASAYPLPENSGSAFYTYALAYGVNTGILDREYLPVIQRAWAGLVAHIYEDGRIGCIQPIGTAPGDYPATASYVFGTGAFLLAGSEVYRLAGQTGLGFATTTK